MSHAPAKPTLADLASVRALEGVTQPVLVVQRGTVVWANPAAAGLFGAADAEKLAGSAVSALLGEAAERTARTAPALAEGVAPLRFGAGATTLDGRPVPVEVAAVSIPWNDGEAVQVALSDHTALDALRRRSAEQDARFRELIDGSLQGIYVHVNHRFLYVNRSFAEIFGYDDPQQVLAMGDVTAVYAPEERERMLGYYQARRAGGKPPTRYEFQGMRRDGARIWLENLVRMADWNGQRAVLAMVVDITERKQAEQRVLANEEKYRNVVEGSVQGILVHRQGEPLFVNQAFADQFGFESPEAVYAAGNVDKLIAEEDYDRLLGYVQARLAGRPVPSRYIYRGRRVDGRLIWVENLVRVVNWEGEPALQVATVDVTERIDAEQRLRESERLMRMVLDQLPHLVFVKGPDLRYRFVNQSFSNFHRLQPEDIVGRQVEDLPVSLESDRDTFVDTDRQVLTTEEPVDLPSLTLTPVGRGPGIFRLQKIPLRDEEGHVVGLVGISEEITEQRRAEEELHRSRQLLQSVFDLIPLWVFVKDDQRRFVMINRKMAEDYALSGPMHPGELVDLATTITEEERSAVYELDERVLREGHPVDEPELTITLPGRGPRQFRSARMPLRDATGKVTGIVGIMEDITDRLRTEQVLRQAQKLESLGVLAGGIAHDFNNLLVTILGNTGLAMVELPPGSTALQPLEHVERAGQRAAELCRQLLAYAGKGSFEIAQVSLNELIEDMSDLLGVSLSKGIELVYRFDAGVPRVEVDATQIRQVVMNLIMNAAEAIGSETGRITISTRRVYAGREQLVEFIQGDQLQPGQFVLLEVEDTGPGIDQETLGRIFDPFFSTKFTGRGLGLAAVLGIVRGHKGALRVVSNPGRGSSFRILLPLGSGRSTSLGTAANAD